MPLLRAFVCDAQGLAHSTETSDALRLPAFPLSDKHPLAQQAAEAAEAAASQGQFWTMHDLLFEHQDALEIDDLYRYADVARLDLSRLKRTWTRVHVSRVMHDVTSGRRSGVTGTPTFFLNEALVPEDARLEDLVLGRMRREQRQI